MTTLLLHLILGQVAVHDLGVDDAVQVIQLVAEAAGDELLTLGLEPFAVAILGANLGVVGVILFLGLALK